VFDCHTLDVVDGFSGYIIFKFTINNSH